MKKIRNIKQYRQSIVKDEMENYMNIRMLYLFEEKGDLINGFFNLYDY
jgi:hypothetical protein